MNMQTVRKIAKEHGLKPEKMGKLDLVKRIQKQEGNFDCFGSAHDGYCDQDNCLWKMDCLTSSTQRVTV